MFVTLDSPNRVSLLSWRKRQAEKESRDRPSRNRLTIEREIVDAVMVEIEEDLLLVHERQVGRSINDLGVGSGRQCKQTQAGCSRGKSIGIQPSIAGFGKLGGFAG
jgi:hypothetical protein